MKIYSNVVMIEVDKIKPYWRNPRINEKTVDALVKIIPEVGFNVPLFIDKENVIIKGHARYKACVKLGIKEIPCIISENSEEQNRLDRVADNKVSELAEWDIGDLRYELENIDFELTAIGFDVPKDNFMEYNYFQQEFEEVEQSQFQKEQQEILKSNSATIENKVKNDIEQQIDVDVEDNAIKTKKFIQVVCPKCGEKTIIYL